MLQHELPFYFLGDQKSVMLEHFNAVTALQRHITSFSFLTLPAMLLRNKTSLYYKPYLYGHVYISSQRDMIKEVQGHMTDYSIGQVNNRNWQLSSDQQDN